MQTKLGPASQSDLVMGLGDLFATVEFKRSGSRWATYWLVSGLTEDGLPAVLVSLSVSLNSTTEAELVEEARKLGEAYILPFAAELPRTPGIGDRIAPLTGERRRQMFFEHMKHHFSIERSGSLTLQLQTECLFRMASYLQLSSPVKDIAEFQGVATATVQQRVKYARKKGRLPKVSDPHAKKYNEEE
jgi:hypothetical protein